MTVTLNFKPELEAWLFAQAKANGVTVEAYVRSVVESALLPAMRHRSTPPLSDYAVSRESFYEDRDH